MLPSPTILSSDPAATLADAARRRDATQPTVSELVALAITGTDFLGDITTSCDTMALAAEYADQAAERWEDARGVLFGTVLPERIDAARCELRDLAESVLGDAAEGLSYARIDSIEAGDLDDDGNPIPYETYRSI